MRKFFLKISTSGITASWRQHGVRFSNISRRKSFDNYKMHPLDDDNTIITPRGCTILIRLVLEYTKQNMVHVLGKSPITTLTISQDYVFFSFKKKVPVIIIKQSVGQRSMVSPTAVVIKNIIRLKIISESSSFFFQHILQQLAAISFIQKKCPYGFFFLSLLFFSSSFEWLYVFLFSFDSSWPQAVFRYILGVLLRGLIVHITLFFFLTFFFSFVVNSISVGFREHWTYVVKRQGDVKHTHKMNTRRCFCRNTPIRFTNNDPRCVRK